MDEALYLAESYFAAPGTHWWRWSKDGSFVELASGKSVSPQQQIFQLLQSLAPQGLPPLDLVILFLVALRQEVDELLAELSDFPETQAIVQEMQRLGCFREENSTSKQSACADFLFSKLDQRGSPEEAKQIVERMREIDFRYLNSDVVARELKHEVLNKLKTLSSLSPEQAELHAESGFDALPEPEALDLDFAGSLRGMLEEMAQEAEWAPLEELTRQALAALSLPKRLSESQSLPDGGYQDISNRGDLDRLLPGELAYDDELLLLRLSQGEALFLERERPPHQPAAREVLLLDNGIRMWGEPKMLSLASALAIGCQLEPGQHLRILRPAGEGLEPVHLQSRDGLTDYLYSTEAHLEFPAAAIQFVEEHPEDTVMLVTEKNCLAHLIQRGAFAQRKAPLYVILVDYHAQVEIHQWSNSGLKLLRQASLDLDGMLTLPEKDDAQKEELPAYQLKPCPIRLPFDTSNLLTCRLDRDVYLSSSDRVMLAQWRTGIAYPKLLQLQPELRIPIGMGLRSMHKVWLVLAQKRVGRIDWSYVEVDTQNGQLLVEQRLQRDALIDRRAFCGLLDEQLVIIQAGTAMLYEPYSGAKLDEFRDPHLEHISQYFYADTRRIHWAKLGVHVGSLKLLPHKTKPQAVAVLENEIGHFAIKANREVWFEASPGDWVLKSPEQGSPYDPKGSVQVGPDGMTLKFAQMRYFFRENRWVPQSHHTAQRNYRLMNAKQLGLRWQIKGLFLDGHRFGILNRKGNLQQFTFKDRCELSEGQTLHSRQNCYWFRPEAGTEELGISFDNGSRILLDANHLIHIIPSDPQQPKLSLVVMQQFFVGCTEHGERFGHDHFLLNKASLTPAATEKLFQGLMGALL